MFIWENIMSLELLKKLRSSVVLTCLLAGTLTITACQQSETEENAVDDINTEETVPMSAEPADPNEVVIDTIDTIDTTDTAMDEEKDDTTASTESDVN